MLRVGLARVRPEKETRLRDWLAELQRRRGEVVETFLRETVRQEQVFIIQGESGPLLVYVVDADDLERASAAYKDSPHPIDSEHRAVLRECLLEYLQVELLFDCLARLGPARLVAAIPKLASLDIDRSLDFFERLGFRRRGSYPDYGIVERDGVTIHFWLCSDARIPKETACRITVEGIETLFEDFSAKGVVHPKGKLARMPWGLWEFSILDPDGNLVTFQQAAA